MKNLIKMLGSKSEVSLNFKIYNKSQKRIWVLICSDTLNSLVRYSLTSIDSESVVDRNLKIKNDHYDTMYVVISYDENSLNPSNRDIAEQMTSISSSKNTICYTNSERAVYKVDNLSKYTNTIYNELNLYIYNKLVHYPDTQFINTLISIGEVENYLMCMIINHIMCSELNIPMPEWFTNHIHSLNHANLTTYKQILSSYSPIPLHPEIKKSSCSPMLLD